MSFRAVNGGSITSVFNAVSQYGADNTGAVDATTKIQNALDAAHTAGGGIVFLPRGSYTISASGNTGPNSAAYSLKTYSNVELWLDPDATITLAANSNCCMIVNAAWVAGSGRDTNISIHGGTWARGANGGSAAQARHSILMQRVDTLHIYDLTVTSTGGKFFVAPYAVTDFVIERITANVFSNIVQCDGACKNGTIQDIYGTSGDVSVALVPIDYVAYQNGDLGNIENVTIRNIFTTSSTSAVQVLGGSSGGVSYGCIDVTVDNVNCAATAYAVYIGGDASDTGTQNPVSRDIKVSRIRNSVGSGVEFIATGTGSVSGVELSHIEFADRASKYTIFLNGGTSASALTVNDLVVHDCFWTGTTGTNHCVLVSAATCSRLTLRNVEMNTGALYMVGFANANASVDTLRFEHVTMNLQGALGGGLVTSNATTPTLTNVFISNYRALRCYWAAGDYLTATNLHIAGMEAGTINGLANVRATATLTLRDVRGLNGSHAHRITSAGTVAGLIYSSGTGAPTIGGQVGDLYDRQDGGSGTYRYRCTVAGDDGAATWAGIL